MKRAGLRVLVILGLFLLLMACGDDGDDTQADGDNPADGDNSTDGDTNDDPVSLKLDGEELSFSNSIMMDAFYTEWEDRTGLGDQKVGMYFPGKSTGTFTSADKATFQVIDEDGTEWVGGDEFSDFTVVVTAYGAVGEKIEGTFSGTVVNSDDYEATATVTDGRFSVVRSEDN